MSQPYYDCRSQKWGLRICGKQSILAARQSVLAMFFLAAEQNQKELRWAAKVLTGRRREKLLFFPQLAGCIKLCESHYVSYRNLSTDRIGNCLVQVACREHLLKGDSLEQVKEMKADC